MIELIERGNIQDPAVVRALEYLVSRLRGLLSQTFNQDGQLIVADPNLAIVPLGAVQDYAGATAPSGWLLCDGAQVSRVKYQGLFSILGTAYGSGDGSTTFNLPDTRGRFALGKSAAGTGDTLGETGGELDHDHSVGSHTHGVGTLATAAAGGHGHTSSAVGDHSHSVSGATSSASGTQAGLASGGAEFQVSDSHVHTFSVTSGSNGGHQHTISNENNHTHTLSGDTGASSGSDTGTANPAYIVFTKIIFTGVA